MQRIRHRVAPLAADGRFELYKTTAKHEGTWAASSTVPDAGGVGRQGRTNRSRFSVFQPKRRKSRSDPKHGRAGRSSYGARVAGVAAESNQVPSLRGRRPRRLSPEERKSLTHGDFWIPDEERLSPRAAGLNTAQVPFVVAGVRYLRTHRHLPADQGSRSARRAVGGALAAHALHEAGFVMRLGSPRLAKGTVGDRFVDLIYGMGTGLPDRRAVAGPWTTASCRATSRDRAGGGAHLHRPFISERHATTCPTSSTCSCASAKR
jgi:hypothetical protein